jgi:hypothetical protein
MSRVSMFTLFGFLRSRSRGKNDIVLRLLRKKKSQLLAVTTNEKFRYQILFEMSDHPLFAHRVQQRISRLETQAPK